MSLRNYLDKLNRYFWFSQEEWISFGLAVIILSIIYIWPTGNVLYLEDIPLGIIFIAITLFVHHAGQRMMALSLGFRAEQRLWWYGPLIGLVLVLISGGKLKFLAATSTIIHLLPIHRLGAFRYGPNLATIAKVVLAGPILNILFSAVIKSFEWAGLLSPEIGHQLFVLNLAFAAWNLVPIPPLDGSKVFFYSRLTYAFLFGSIGSYAFMVYFLHIYSYIIALLIGCLTWLLYYILIESGLK